MFTPFRAGSVATKLTVSALAFLVPIVVMATFIVRGYAADITFSQREVYGNRIIQPLVHIAAALPAAAGSNADAAGAARETISQAFDTLLIAHQAVGEELQFTEERLAIRNRSGLDAPTVAARWPEVARELEPDTGEIALFDDILEMIVHAGDTSNLILDPDLDSYYLMDVTLLAVPTVLQNVYEMTAQGTLSATEAAIRHSQLRDAMDRIRASIATAINEDPNFYGELPGIAPALQTALDDYTAAADPLLATLEDGRAGASVQRRALQSAVISLLAATAPFWDSVAEQQNALLETRIATYERDLLVTILLSALAVLLAGTFVAVIGRAITRQAQATEHGLSIAAGKDLTGTIEIAGSDELGRAAHAAQRLVDGLRAFVASLQTQSRDTRTYAQQLSESSTTLMDTTDSVAGSVTELSAAAEEFSRTLEQITANADRQRSHARDTTAHVQNLERTFQTVSTRMEQVTQSAADNSRVSSESVAGVAATIEEVAGITADLKTIGQQVRTAGTAAAGVDTIVSTVRDISDKTALLAMNAAIEAAHAGNQGRGFAVVAQEIRTLASNTAGALKQIETQLNEVRSTIDATVSTATAAESRAERIDQSTKNAQESLGTVTENAAAVVTSIDQIRTTFQEQSQAIHRVQAAMEDVDQLSASVLEAIDEQSRGAAEMVDSITTIKDSIEEVRTVGASIRGIGDTLQSESERMERDVAEYTV
ncbi:MAG TPA: methyl-accepting chemotaxis protein [Alkalispirochaeta sp.]|nr:methyl-accepting chemotaxis protein [Alkalispirochaeta sp.]